MIDEPQSNAAARELIDATYGHPRPWGFLLALAALCLPAALLTAWLLSSGDTGSLTEQAQPAPHELTLLGKVAIAAAWAVTFAFGAWLCIIRRYYRLMFGSAYHRG